MMLSLIKRGQNLLENKQLALLFKVLQSISQIWHAKFLNDGLALGSSKFSVLPQLSPKMMLSLIKRGQNLLKNKQLALLI